MQPILLAVLGLASATSARAQVVEGHVREATSGRLIPDAQVSWLDDKGAVVADAVTDIGGRFLVEVQASGPLTIHISRDGYYGVSEVVDVDRAATQGVGVRLTPIQTSPDSIVVYVGTPSLPPLDSLGFYDRARAGKGIFYTYFDFLEMQDVFTVQQLLRLMTRWRYGGRVSGATGRARPCTGPILIDGSISNTLTTRARREGIPLSSVEAIEVYTLAEVPPQFRDIWLTAERSSCGLVVLWTRSWTPLPA
ncbi:MAG: carboxypeptidase regulatory-like domain-containing protein [Gemmatimonadota bacterium]